MGLLKTGSENMVLVVLLQIGAKDLTLIGAKDLTLIGAKDHTLIQIPSPFGITSSIWDFLSSN